MADCTGTVVSVAKVPADPYVGPNYKETAVTCIAPFSGYQAVIVNWPAPITGTGTVSLPQLAVKTIPTGAAIAGPGQTAYFFVGDAANGIADAYGSTPVTDTTDVDLDGVTTNSVPVATPHRS